MSENRLPEPIPPANSRQVAGTHYRSEIQHWDYVVANDIPYLEAQVIKYVTRWKKKNGIEDLEKARHYLDKLIEVEKAKAIDSLSLTTVKWENPKIKGGIVQP